MDQERKELSGRCGDCRHFHWCDCVSKIYFTEYTGADWDAMENVGTCDAYGMLTVEAYEPARDDDECFEP